MSRLAELIAELEAEAGTTRRHLERLSDAHLDWRPHPKSYTAGGLGSHLVDCVRWAGAVFGGDELEFDPATYRPFRADTVARLTAGFDEAVDAARHVMAGCPDDSADVPWTLRMQGRVWFRKPREAVFRDMTLSHLIHHRGQLSVYLRLLEIAVPGSYGPSADEQA